jgi:hypothetical protein
MPATALLHQNKLEDFKTWLDSIGRAHRPGGGNYQVLQVQWGTGWQAIYKRANAEEHLSVPHPLVPLVRRFVRETRAPEPKPPPGYTAEELERDNPFNAWMRDAPL